MKKMIKYFLIILTSALVGLGIERDTAYCLSMTIGAIDDAGQSPNEEAYLKFVYASGYHVVNASGPQWTFASQVYSYATSHSIPVGWHLESAGNIWSSEKIVGEALNNLSAGLYRISVAGGAFMYDSFSTNSLKWSDYAGQWRWQLQIQAREFEDGNIVDYHDYILGFFGFPIDYYATEFEALQSNLGKYVDIPVNEGGSLTFWIWDTNTIDNSGGLTFNVVLIPEPSTIILAGTGLFFLARRFRKHLSLH